MSRLIHLETFVRHAPAAIAMFDLNMCYICASDRWKSSFNLGDVDLIGKSHYEVFPEISEPWKAIHRNCLAGNSQKSDEDLFIREDGKKEYLKWEVYPWYTPDNKIGGIIIGAESITHIVHERNEALEKLKNMAAINSELEQFVLIVSHDLREPLRVLISYSELLNEGFRNQLNGNGSEYLKILLRSAQRMYRLLEDLLALLKTGEGLGEMSPVDLNKILKESLFDLNESIKKVNATINCPNLPIIRGYENLLRQLFQNLLGNSFKYSRKGVPPIVSISYRILRSEDRFESGAKKIRESLELRFSDNGIGFDNKFKGQIFKVFQRLHDSNTYEGTGVGLAICKKIVERHSGTIEAFSKVDEGTTFIITLPIVAEISA